MSNFKERALLALEQQQADEPLASLVARSMQAERALVLTEVATERLAVMRVLGRFEDALARWRKTPRSATIADYQDAAEAVALRRQMLATTLDAWELG